MDTLPLELRVQIASLLNRTSDLHALTLTCHSSRTAFTPSLYEHFYYESREWSDRDPIFHPANPGSPYIRTFRYCERRKRDRDSREVSFERPDWSLLRSLHFDAAVPGSQFNPPSIYGRPPQDEQDRYGFESADWNLMRAVQLIPPNTSKTFVCDAEVTILGTTFIAFSHTQSSSLEHSSLGRVTGLNEFTRGVGLPTSRKSKTFGIPYMTSACLASMRRVIANCPRLRRVTMCWASGSEVSGHEDRVEPVIFLNELFPQIQELVSLEHSAINISASLSNESFLDSVVDVSKLVTLHLGSRFPESALWLGRSTSAFRQTKPALRGLLIKCYSQHECHGSQEFLRCFEGLRYAISINSNGFSHNIDLDCLSSHAPTSERLLVGCSGAHFRHAHPEKFGPSLGRASKLQELGINMPPGLTTRAPRAYPMNMFAMETITAAPCLKSSLLCEGEIPVDAPMLPESASTLPMMQQAGVSPNLQRAAAYVTEAYRLFTRTGNYGGENLPVVGFRLIKSARSLLACGRDMWYFVPQAHVDDDGAPSTVAVPIKGSDLKEMRPKSHLFDSDEDLTLHGRLPAYFDWFDYPAWSSDENS